MLMTVVRSGLQHTLDELRNELEENIAMVRREMESNLGTKAGSHEVAALSSRLDVWSQSSPAYNKSSRGRKAERQAQGDESPEVIPRSPSPDPNWKREARSRVMATGSDGKKPNFCSSHDNCKAPTCPSSLKMSQSLSRLPELKQKMNSAMSSTMH